MSIAIAIAAALIILLTGVVGVVLTLLTLPGVWLILIAALACQFAFGEPYLFDVWTLAAAIALALLGEVFEFVSGAVGAKRAGGGRSGAVGSIVGALVGAVAGSLLIPIPLLGTLIGAVVGAGAGALIAERGVAGREWSHAFRIGASAATSRFTALLVKSVIAAAITVMLAVAAVV